MLKRVRFNDWIAMQNELETKIMTGYIPEPLSQERIDQAVKYAKEFLSKYKKEQKR